MKPLLTVAEVAKILHYHPNQVRELIRDGILPACKLRPRGTYRIDPDDLRGWLQMRKDEATDLAEEAQAPEAAVWGGPIELARSAMEE